MAETINILIVDDDENTRKTFSRILKLKGYNVEEADSGADAVAAAKERFFHIAAVDVRLPDLSGLDVLRAVREINEDTVILMVTGYASVDSSIEAMNKGAYSYLTKPLNMDAVLVVIERALEKQRLSLENRRLLDELRRANRELKKLSQVKSDFVSTVSHELRTPLTTMKEFTSIVLDGLSGPLTDSQKEYLEIIKSNIGRLSRLIDNLLDISKIEAGKIELKKTLVDIVGLAGAAVYSLMPEAAKKHIELKTSFSAAAVNIYADPDKITQVITNLINNAIKFTPDNGKIAVEIEAAEKEIECRVIDTGSGIAPEDMDKLFTKFQQLNRASASGAKGTGLGLAISKELIQMHDGKIWAESKPEQGSKFVFTLPI